MLIPAKVESRVWLSKRVTTCTLRRPETQVSLLNGVVLRVSCRLYILFFKRKALNSIINYILKIARDNKTASYVIQ